MDSEARNKVRAIKVEDWKKLGYSDSTTANDDSEGLTNEIDPIFHYNHPSRPPALPIWAELTGAEYKELLVDIKPMLQLASLLLRSPPGLNADCDLYYSPRKHPKDREAVKDVNGQPVLEFRHIETTDDYCPHREALANDALDRLAGVVTFRVISEEDHPDMAKTLGLTEIFFQARPRGVNIQDDTKLSKGMGSRIFIRDTLVTDLRRLSKGGAQDTIKLSSLTFKEAAMLCHELFHAKYMATDSPLLADALVETSMRGYEAMRDKGRKDETVANNEPLYEDDTDAELGYVWEQCVFGGHIQFDRDVNNCLFFSKWPSIFTSPGYLRRGAWRAQMTKYVVPMHYIMNLLRQKFWDDMKEGDFTALRIKKLIGIRVNCRPDLADLDWNINDSSEVEYPLERPSLPRVSRERVGERLVDSRTNETRQDRLTWQRLIARGCLHDFPTDNLAPIPISYPFAEHEMPQFFLRTIDLSSHPTLLPAVWLDPLTATLPASLKEPFQACDRLERDRGKPPKSLALAICAHTPTYSQEQSNSNAQEQYGKSVQDTLDFKTQLSSGGLSPYTGQHTEVFWRKLRLV